MKILVVGCGSIGRRHVANACLIADTAVVDRDASLANEVATAFGAQTFSSVQDALDWSPDGVVVATPHDYHLAIATLAIEAGADVLIEKPISHAEHGIHEFLTLVAKSGRRAFVVCNMRFHPGPAALKSNISAVGKPLFARAWYGNYLPSMRPGADYRKLYAASKAAGGGVILDAIHELDYLCWIFGDVSEIGCHSAKLSDLEIDVEDYAEIYLNHSSGVRSAVHLDYLQRFKRRGCEIVGTNGTLIWQSEGKNPERCLVKLYRADSESWETLTDIEDMDVTKPYVELMQTFVSALSGESATELLDAATAAKELHLTLAAHRSAAIAQSVETL